MEDEILQQIERESMARHQSVREFILGAGRPDVVADLDATMRSIRLGTHGAGATWQSISEPQRRVLAIMATGRKLCRARGSRTRYMAVGEPFAIADVCGLPTVRNLCARELVHVDGGLTDPEGVIVLTERGAFVAKHGPMQPRI